MKNFQSKAVSAQEILEENLGEFPYLLSNILPMYGIAGLVGSSDLGKSYFLQQLGAAVATNAPDFLNTPLEINSPSTLYVSTEDDKYSMNSRLQNFQKQVKDENLEKLRFLFEHHNLFEELDAELTEKPASLVVIDTFADVYKGSINDVMGVRTFLSSYKDLSSKHECLIIFNHHCGKNIENRPPGKDNVLGSQGFESAMRTLLELRKDQHNPNARHLCLVKANHVSGELKQTSLELNFDFKAGFDFVGEGLPFDQLCKRKNSDAEIIGKIIEMKKHNIPIRKMTDSLVKDGHTIGRSKVAVLAKKISPKDLDSEDLKG